MIDLLIALLVNYYAVRSGAPVSDEDRTRLATLARVNVEVCEAHPIKGWSLAQCVALVTTTQMWESGLLRKVHAGEQRGPSGERCVMQLHREVVMIPRPVYAITREEWEKIEGTDEESTRACVTLGLRALSWHITRCNIRLDGHQYLALAGLFNEYHRPSARCRAMSSWLSGRRADTWATLAAKLSRGEK